MSKNRGLKTSVLQFFMEGKSEAEIAMLLDCNRYTVRWHLNKQFRDAHSQKRAAKRISNKISLVDTHGGKCSVCGYDKCRQALQFHHLDPFDKSFAIAESNFRDYEKLKAETEKCILVCANCHAEIEAGIVLLPVDVK